MCLRICPAASSKPHAQAVHAHVVADGGEIFDAFADQGADQVFRDAAQAEAAHHDCGAVGDVADSLVSAADYLVHKREILNEIVDL